MVVDHRDRVAARKATVPLEAVHKAVREDKAEWDKAVDHNKAGVVVVWDAGKYTIQDPQQLLLTASSTLQDQLPFT